MEASERTSSNINYPFHLQLSWLTGARSLESRDSYLKWQQEKVKQPKLIIQISKVSTRGIKKRFQGDLGFCEELVMEFHFKINQHKIRY